MTRETHVIRPNFMVECLDCGWTAYSQNAQGLAAQHHDQTGHSVRGGPRP